MVCPAERPGWPQFQFEAALASPARGSSRPLRRVVAWAGRERERQLVAGVGLFLRLRHPGELSPAPGQPSVSARAQGRRAGRR
jgi:hypothetical protein